MENFRELEKEFKKKQFSKKALQGHKHGKGMGGIGGRGDSSSDNDGENSESMSESGESSN